MPQLVRRAILWQRRKKNEKESLESCAFYGNAPLRLLELIMTLFAALHGTLYEPYKIVHNSVLLWSLVTLNRTYFRKLKYWQYRYMPIRYKFKTDSINSIIVSSSFKDECIYPIQLKDVHIRQLNFLYIYTES